MISLFREIDKLNLISPVVETSLERPSKSLHRLSEKCLDPLYYIVAYEDAPIPAGPLSSSRSLTRHTSPSQIL